MKAAFFIPRARAGFTLAEMIVSVAIAAMVMIGGYFVLNMGLVLYAKNFSLNNTHLDGRRALEKLADKIHLAADAPRLIDASGEPLAGDGPAAGIRFARFNASGYYIIPANVNATATSFTVNVTSGQAAPKIGDVALVSDLGFQAQVDRVSGSGGTRTLHFTGTVGSYFPRPRTTGVAITSPASPNQARCQLLEQVAFVATDSQLRFYPRAMSVSVDGAAFKNSANFQVLSELLPPAGSAALPFSYTDPNRRTVDVDLRVESRRYHNRGYRSFLTFSSVHTKLAARSAGAMAMP